MKKLLFALIAILVLISSAACAEDAALPTEEVTGMIDLWTYTFAIEDQAGNEAQLPLRVTFEPKAPVTLTRYVSTEDMTDGICVVNVTREGLADVMISISPANRGLHFNLNDYTDTMLEEYIQAIVEGNFQEGQYEAEVRKSEGGNTYVRIGDANMEILSTIYDDFTMEFFLSNIEVDAEGNVTLHALTDADRAFAEEMFASVWTAGIETPVTDTEFTLFVSKKFMTDLDADESGEWIDRVNAAAFVVHGENGLVRFALKSGDEEVFHMTLSEREDGYLAESDLWDGKGILFSSDVLAKLNREESAKEAQALEEAKDALLQSIGSIDLTQTISAAAGALTTGIDEDGLTFTIPSENAGKVLSALAQDLKASQLPRKIVSLFSSEDIRDEDLGFLIDLITESFSAQLPEGNFLEAKLSIAEDGSMSLTGVIAYRIVDYVMDEAAEEYSEVFLPASIRFEAKTAAEEDGALHVTSRVVSGADGAAEKSVCDFSLLIPENGEFESALIFGAMAGETLTPAFSVTLDRNLVEEELVNLDTSRLAFLSPDADGNLAPQATLTALSTGREGDSINAVMLDLAGYDEPVFILRIRSVFGENITPEAPAEILKFEDMDKDQMTALMETAKAHLAAFAENGQ